MRSYQKVLTILAIVISLCQNIHSSTCDSTSLALMEQTWREFRAIHPFGFQTIGLKHYGDTCVFVMSEPAEWVKIEDLVALFTKYDGHLIECIQPYGCNGELHDFVGCLRKDIINSQLFRSELFNLLYFTDYKAYYTDLDRPTKHIYFSDKKINFYIESYDFKKLLLNERLKVSNRYLSFNNLMKSKTRCNKLYFSQNRGLVVWVLDSVGILQSVSDFLKTSRSFALDTDLILGSIYENGKVAIIGREREVSVNILPPLRSETICQLLGGYIQYANPLPMRMIDDPNDFTFNNHPWLIFNSLETDSVQIETDSVQTDIYYAPIQISLNVRNSELGNLMYLTDIILKSWCENGKVKDKFINYPFPKSFPYPNGVTHELGDSLRVYWRMLESMFGISSIYNTGCCFPEISSFTKRDSIQNDKDIQVSCNLDSYFAEQQCVDLARIKQYSILLEAFRNLKVGPSEIQGNNRQKTPTITVSNKKWLYGGYQLQGQIVKKVVKGMTKKATKVPKNKVPRGSVTGVPGLGVPPRGSVTGVSGLSVPPGGSVIGVPGIGGPPIIPPVSVITSHLRKDVIHQPSGTNRGFDPKTHNTASKSLLISDAEKQELLERSDREKKMMDELRMQLRQFNIPVKVILNEQRIIIHAINVLNNYDKGYEYEWAA